MKKIIFLNGKFAQENEAKVSILTPGFLSGFGLFETMRSYNGNIIYLNEHLSRLRESSKFLGMRFPYPPVQLKGIIKKTVLLNNIKDASVRLTLFKKDSATGTLVAVKRYEPYPPRKYARGFSVKVSTFRQDDTFSAQIKTTNRILYELSYQEAKDAGFDEALILNNRGNITETSRSNIFFVKERALFTPALLNGCLNGITRRVIFDLAKKNNIKIYEGKFTLSDLHSADEAFLTNSLMGVMPLVSVEKKGIANAKAGKITKNFMDKYNLLFKSGV